MFTFFSIMPFSKRTTKCYGCQFTLSICILITFTYSQEMSSIYDLLLVCAVFIPRNTRPIDISECLSALTIKKNDTGNCSRKSLSLFISCDYHYYLLLFVHSIAYLIVQILQRHEIYYKIGD